MAAKSLAVAVTAGIASFASPCVVPLVPAFLSGLGGSTLDGRPRRRDLVVNTVLFVAGFALSFAAVGVVLGTAMAGLVDSAGLVARLAGLVIVAFGLHVTGLVRVRHLDRRVALGDRLTLDGSRTMAFVFGLAFAVGWTPCVGPLLGSTLAVAAAQPAEAVPVLLAYAGGIGTPFLAVALVPERALATLDRNRRLLGLAHRGFGVALLALGVLVFTGTLSALGAVGTSPTYP